MGEGDMGEGDMGEVDMGDGEGELGGGAFITHPIHGSMPPVLKGINSPLILHMDI